jgi:hypothetical protein
MKNGKLLMAILAITLVLGMTACKEPTDGGNNGGSTTNATYTFASSTSIGGSKITGENGSWSITAPVQYVTDIPIDLNDAKSRNDFSYILHYSARGYWPDDPYNTVFFDDPKLNPITSEIPGSSITVNNEKVNITLGVPNPANLVTFAESFGGGIPSGFTVSQSDAKLYYIEWFSTSDFSGNTGYALGYASLKGFSGCLIYVDKDVTVKGTYIDTYKDTYGTTYKNTFKYDFSLKAGWNYTIAFEGTTMPDTNDYMWAIGSPFCAMFFGLD